MPQINMHASSVNILEMIGGEVDDLSAKKNILPGSTALARIDRKAQKGCLNNIMYYQHKSAFPGAVNELPCRQGHYEQDQIRVDSGLRSVQSSFYLNPQDKFNAAACTRLTTSRLHHDAKSRLKLHDTKFVPPKRTPYDTFSGEVCGLPRSLYQVDFNDETDNARRSVIPRPEPKSGDDENKDKGIVHALSKKDYFMSKVFTSELDGVNHASQRTDTAHKQQISAGKEFKQRAESVEAEWRAKSPELTTETRQFDERVSQARHRRATPDPSIAERKRQEQQLRREHEERAEKMRREIAAYGPSEAETTCSTATLYQRDFDGFEDELRGSSRKGKLGTVDLLRQQRAAATPDPYGSGKRLKRKAPLIVKARPPQPRCVRPKQSFSVTVSSQSIEGRPPRGQLRGKLPRRPIVEASSAAECMRFESAD